jgi:hypothetical protein
MTEPAVQLGATVTCKHPPGRAAPMAVNGRVLLSGQPTVSLNAPWTVAGCPNPFPPGPCLAAFWSLGSVRVTSMGTSLVVKGGTASCAPTGSPLTVEQVQTRVRVA